MNQGSFIKVLLVEDDEDDYILTREICDDIRGWRFELDWVRTFEAGLNAAIANRHEVCLIDYRLGAHTGIELIEAAVAGGCQSPMILLTGLGEHQIDMAAMRAGAADYLVKQQLEASQLERSVRYAVERKRAAARAAFEQARLAAFGTEVGLVLTRAESLDQLLQNCVTAMDQFLNAALAQIWVFDAETASLKPRAMAGPLAGTFGSLMEVPVMLLKLDELRNGQPLLIKQVLGDSRVSDQAWVRREEIASFAAVPLLVEQRLVGLMSMFSTIPLTESTLQEMSSVAHGIALGIARKNSELALDESEGRYRSVVENICEVVFQMDEFGNWTFLNTAWTVATGYAVQDSVHTFFLNYIHKDDRAENRRIFLELIEQKLDYCRYETRLLTKDEKVLWMEVFMQRTQDTEGRATGLTGSLNNVTQRRESELQVQKLAAFPRVNPNPVLEFAADGSISYFNDAAGALAKLLSLQDVAGLLPPGSGQIVKECLAVGENRLREQIVVAGRTLTWSFFPVVSTSVVHGYGVDITDVVNLEAQFRHAQKLESIGQLAAGVAHDFNNLLTVIQGYADLLLMQCKEDLRFASALKQISDATRRASSLTRQLLTFSRKQVIQTRILSLNSVLTNLTSILGRLLGEDIALVKNFADALPSIEADAGMIEQVVMNLAVNARDAMPRGGQLRLATRVVEVDERHVQRQVAARPGSFICLEVSDTGCGMNQETLSRIFEPFFSTKEVGKGTGLGLATVYGIIKQHQGWIEVYSEPDRGTTFKIYLPAIMSEAEAPPDTTFRRREVAGGSETILLVEDEHEVRELVREILIGYNYTVIPAANGVEALKIWEQHGGRVDLLLTDLVMPEGINGHELATRLRERKPGLKVIYTSGYTAGAVESDANGNNGLFLQKPYRPPALASLVRRCLDGNLN